MYVYIKSEQHLWTVGFYSPDGKWHPESDHDNRPEAAIRVAYLNGSRSYPDQEADGFVYCGKCGKRNIV